MRLLNVHTLKLEEFDDIPSRPSYIIISHRWYRLEEEASYHEWLVSEAEFETRLGWIKIQQLCGFVKSRLAKTRINWIWIDTCCIDKRNSVELHEAINSMFRWYQEAAFCLAYLYDVTAPSGQPLCSLKDSEWFTRGWTLQELLAPPLVLFIDKDWNAFGHKAPGFSEMAKASVELVVQSTPAINEELASITGIRLDVLSDYGKAANVGIEEKQRWMRDRTTTRVEDKAYCQLGIFGVFMSPIYGEGEEAMVRLQRKVKKAERRRHPGPLEDVDQLAGELTRVAENMKGTATAAEVRDLKKDFEALQKKMARLGQGTSQAPSSYIEISQPNRASGPLPQYSGPSGHTLYSPQGNRRTAGYHNPISLSRSSSYGEEPGYRWPDSDHEDEDKDGVMRRAHDGVVRAQPIRQIAHRSPVAPVQPVRPSQSTRPETRYDNAVPRLPQQPSHQGSSLSQTERSRSQFFPSVDTWFSRLADDIESRASGSYRTQTNGVSAPGHRSGAVTAHQHKRTGSAAMSAPPDGMMPLTRESDIGRARREAAGRGWYLDDASNRWYRYDAETDELVYADGRRVPRPVSISRSKFAEHFESDRSEYRHFEENNRIFNVWQP